MKAHETPKSVFQDISSKKGYIKSEFDAEEVKQVFAMILEDYEFGRRLRHIENPNWRVIFNIHYDVVRELCGQLMQMKGMKTSNHQGLFAFISLNFPDLNEWDFFETIREMRNRNKYMALDISKGMWDQIELNLDLLVSSIVNPIKELLSDFD